MKNKLKDKINVIKDVILDSYQFVKKEEPKDFSTKPVSSKKDLKQLLKQYKQMKEGAGPFSRISFPTVRRVYSGLIANQIVSVQPMALPTGLLTFMDYSYSGMTGSVSFEGTKDGAIKTDLSGSSVGCLDFFDNEI